MKINNKDLVQSYVLTTAKYDFTADEKRVLYRIVEVLQAKTNGLKLKYSYSIQEDLMKENTEFTLPISCFLKESPDGRNTNYAPVKKALTSLRNKTIEYEDEESWGVYGIIEMPRIKKYQSMVTFTVTPLLMGAFLNFSKGFRKYELAAAMQFESVYSMRFYELFSGKKEPIIYEIDELKKMFKIEDKYKNKPVNFIKKVIDVAQKELTSKAPYSFKFEPIKTGRSYTHIKFKPYFIAKNRDQELEGKSAIKQTSIRWDFSKEDILLLKEKFQLTDEGINNNREILIKAINHAEYKDWVSEINGMARKYEIGNAAGFFISQIKKKLE